MKLSKVKNIARATLFYVTNLVWKLRPYLRAHGLRARDVENEAIRLGHQLGRNTIYRVLQGDGPTNFNRDTLVAIIAALRSLTGKKVMVGDLLEYVEMDVPEVLGKRVRNRRVQPNAGDSVK